MPDSTDDLPLLDARHLARRFDQSDAVRDVSLRLGRGRVLGLLGVNGAGKTTTLRLLAGILEPDRGSVHVMGEDVTRRAGARRQRVAYAPERPALDPAATPRESLEFAARLRGVAALSRRAAVAGAIARCELEGFADRLNARLSRGQQQRTGLAMALVGGPSLILLDEPTAGLDPMQAAATRSWIRKLREDASVIVSTHLLADVHACCDEVAVLHEGAIAHVGRLDEWIGDDAFEVRVDRPLDAAFWASLAASHVEAMDESGCAWLIAVPAGDSAAISRHAGARDVGVALLQPRGDALERRFMALVAGHRSPADPGPTLTVAAPQ